MTDSSIKEKTDKIVEIATKIGGLFYSTLRGIYKLSYLLIKYHKIIKDPIYFPKPLEFEGVEKYAYTNVKAALSQLCNGMDKVNFVLWHRFGRRVIW